MEEKDKGVKTKMPSSPPNRHSKEKGRLEEGEKGEGWRERETETEYLWHQRISLSGEAKVVKSTICSAMGGKITI